MLGSCCGYPCGKSNADLRTFCAEFDCPVRTLEPASGVYLVEGCGLVSFHYAGGYSATTSYFDTESEKLVGVSSAGDQTYGANPRKRLVRLGPGIKVWR